MFSARSSIPDEIALESLPEAPDEGGTLIINSVSEEATLVHRARRSLGTVLGLRTLRLQLGVSVAVCFALELIMRPLHVGVKRYYSLRTLLQRSRKRTVVIALRLLLIVAMAAVSKLRLSPVDFLWTEAGLVVTSTILAHLQHFKLSLSDIEEYVHRKREKASELPKFKSKRREGGLG
ncbi:hypothetical protein AB1Y20_019757 [Prymnesium parvum]|uniref:Uncharacterized protein n=1 Tax=Prymnesium parvum TaxID=97485 RepID=A0AB34JVC1_PRYPA